MTDTKTSDNEHCQDKKNSNIFTRAKNKTHYIYTNFKHIFKLEIFLQIYESNNSTRSRTTYRLKFSILNKFHIWAERL